MFKELNPSLMEIFKSCNIYKKADMIFEEILKLRSQVLVEKKKYQENIVNINEAFSNVMNSKDTEALLKSYKELKQNSEIEISDLKTKIKEMEKLISRIDHERRAFRDENEFFGGENDKLKEENYDLKGKLVEIEDLLKKTEKKITVL